MRKRSKFAVLIAVLLISALAVTMRMPGAEAQPVLSAWALTPPTINGILELGEWAGADSISFKTSLGESGVLYMMNDEENLYLAIAIQDDDWNSPLDRVVFYFDNDNDGTGPEQGDDQIAAMGASLPYDGYANFEPLLAWRTDPILDVEAAGTGSGGTNYFELSHPLNSTDDDHDFSLSFGDTIGFTLKYKDENAGNGWWPTSYLVPENFAKILVASSSPAPVGGVILPVDTLALLAPYIALLVAIAAAAIGVTVALRDRSLF